MLIYYAIATNMAIFLDESNLGGSQTAGLVISFTTVGGMITGIILVRLEMAFKQFLIPISVLLIGLAFSWSLISTFNLPYSNNC